MNIKINCKQVKNEIHYYDINIELFKRKFTIRLERSQIRYIIGVLDNSINIGINGNKG